MSAPPSVDHLPHWTVRSLTKTRVDSVDLTHFDEAGASRMVGYELRVTGGKAEAEAGTTLGPVSARNERFILCQSPIF